MSERPASPAIHEVSWGRLRVGDPPKTYKDAKLYPGGAREWDWDETGTRHRPGIQPADVQELLDHGAEVVVLSKGFSERLQVQSETRRRLEERGVELHVLQTEEAVALYNRLRESRPAGALIHSTC